MAIPRIKTYKLPATNELPENKMAWKTDPSRSVLLVHDMQEYFVNFYDRTASPIPELIKNINALTGTCRKLNIPVVYSAQPASQTLDERGVLQDFWGDGISNKDDLEPIISEIAPEQNDTLLTKWRYSAFQRTDLLKMMREQGRDQLIICGVYGHIGCITTANDGFMKDIQPFLVADAVADFSREDHLMALKYITKVCGVTQTTDHVLNTLEKCDDEKSGDEKSGDKKCGDKKCGEEKGDPFSVEALRRDVATLMHIDLEEIFEDDNLIFLGLDSIRLMKLAVQWRDLGSKAQFPDLAENPNLKAWSELCREGIYA